LAADGITWVDLCAGAGAVACRLVGGPGIDPPVTYQGGKRKYASAILAALGLRPGQGADRVVLCDPGTWGRAWGPMLNPSETRTAIQTMREWAADGLEGRALFESIVAEGQDEDAGRWLAQFLALQDCVVGGTPVVALPGVGARWRTHGYAALSPAAIAKGFKQRLNPSALARRLSRVASVSWPASTLVLRHSAAEVDPAAIGVDGRTFVYIDPPYAGTTGYGPTLTRAEVVDIARRFDAAGAVVAVSEGEPVDELGWPVVDLTAAHSGQPRTFTKSRSEYLTMNRPPARLVPVQVDLFAMEPTPPAQSDPAATPDDSFPW